MRCPFCGADNDRVIDSRAGQDGYAIRRRRQCNRCGRRYTTYERLEETEFHLVTGISRRLSDIIRDVAVADGIRL